ncbi:MULTISPECIES: hypothetical protein [Burkholderia cepacia complex]|uniref:hypothetical protein n=1 Tax=Burkholderia cepacia complex TaxID=87882 RepID=UPI001905527D|nr:MULTISPECIES: hypothetical protein [Burkholderia cepacia complex]MBJ9754706.1 hypothetical protein [Burkholderia cepacia]MBR7899452.1 hypothetical protein [Burkholderia multivorans]HEM8498368.1 hypothetical protein [Burkholderia multivorans]
MDMSAPGHAALAQADFKQVITESTRRLYKVESSMRGAKVLLDALLESPMFNSAPTFKGADELFHAISFISESLGDGAQAVREIEDLLDGRARQ